MLLETKKLFDAIDGMDPEKFVTFLSEDAVFKFGNAPEVKGRAGIMEAVAGFFSSIKGISHLILQTWEKEGSIAIQGEVTYKRLDGNAITLPFTNVFEMKNNLINRYLIYIDIAPLYAGQ